jgi:site-specific recombinase XerD
VVCRCQKWSDRETIALSGAAVDAGARVRELAHHAPRHHALALRHACGYALASKGLDTRTLQAYLGHRSINSTTRYAAVGPGRFKNIWGKA